MSSRVSSTVGLDPDGRLPICVVEGFGVRIFVRQGHLVVVDGWAGHLRERRYSRSRRDLQRVVVLGHGGSVTLEALAFMADIGVGFLHLDRDGRILAASGALGLDDPRLRRAQAIAWGTPTGMAIARDLLRRKLNGQARTAERLGRADVADGIRQMVPALEDAVTPAQMLVPEAAAGATFWRAWEGVRISWARVDVGRIPDHWIGAGARSSSITGHPRSATTPINALLNLGYSVAAAEARLACLKMGMDPGLGCLHADAKARDSFAYDVVEAVRFDVDEYVLTLLERRTFRRADFQETRLGICRVLPPLSHELAATAPIWRARLGPVVERVARMFLDAPRDRRHSLPSKLTETARSVGRDDIRRRPVRMERVHPTVARSCRFCGEPTLGRRLTCDSCAQARWSEQTSRARAVGPSALARRRALGENPGNTPEANSRRGAKVAVSRRLEAEWDAAHPHPPAPTEFSTEVLPLLSGMKCRDLARRMDVSYPYAASVLRGERIPHPRHWAALRALGAFRRQGQV